jgi:hypothetical protein
MQNPTDAENQNADDGILSTPDTFGAERRF